MYDPNSFDREKAKKAIQSEIDFAKKTSQTLILSNYMPIEEAFKQTTGLDLEIDEDDDNV